MSSPLYTVQLTDPVFAAVQEAAAREHKSVEDMAEEAILRGLAKDEERQSALLPVMERIDRQQKEYNRSPSAAQIVKAARTHRAERRSR